MNATGPTIEDMSSWWRYVQAWRGDATDKQIAQALNISPSAITRWKQGALPNAANITDFARRFGRPVLEALVAAEVISASEAGQVPETEANLRTIGDEQLVDEIRARLARYRGANHGQQHEEADAEQGQEEGREVDCGADDGRPNTRAGLPAQDGLALAANRDARRAASKNGSPRTRR